MFYYLSHPMRNKVIRLQTKNIGRLLEHRELRKISELLKEMCLSIW